MALGKLPLLMLFTRWMVKGLGPELTVELPLSPENPEIGTLEDMALEEGAWMRELWRRELWRRELWRKMAL